MCIYANVCHLKVKDFGVCTKNASSTYVVDEKLQ